MLAWWGTRILASIAPDEIPRLAETRIDFTALLFGLAVSICAAIGFGTVPALRATRIDLNEALKASGKSTSGPGKSGFRRALVTAQIALAFLLLFGVGLLGKSFGRLLNVDPGFDSKNVLSLETYVYSTRYKNPDAELGYYKQAMEHLNLNPGVEASAMTSTLPFADFDTAGLHIRERPLANPSEAASVDRYSVSPGYFRVMRIPLRQGRLFTDQDHRGAQPVAIISESCAKSQFARDNPIGQHIQLGGRHEEAPWATIVGIVGDIRQYGLDRSADMAAYIPQAQNLDFNYSLVARTRVNPRSLEKAAGNAFVAADKTQPVFNVRPLEDYLRASVAERSFTLSLLALFAGLALVLAAVGVYGVISYSVTVQTREFGIRAALGATRKELLRLVSRNAARLLLFGLSAGWLASLALNRFASTLLFGVKTWDIAIHALVVGTLTGAVILATLLPARRASLVDAAVALREE